MKITTKTGAIIMDFPNELMSERNANEDHDQTLVRLDERGGMDPTEAVSNIFDMGVLWIPRNLKDADRHIQLLEHIITVISGSEKALKEPEKTTGDKK